MIGEVFNIFSVIKIFVVAVSAFIVAIVITPLWLKVLYHFKAGKQIKHEAAFQSLRTGQESVFAQMHKHKEGTPTMGGVIVWLSVLIVMLLFSFLAQLFPHSVFNNLNFLTREQTFLPLGALVIAALFGLADDILGIQRKGSGGGGISMKARILLYTLVATGGAWWFWSKLDWNFINIPFLGDYIIGLWFVPIFILIVVATAFSANETDGLDGLSGGVILTVLLAYGAIAFVQGRIDLVAFVAALVGALVAFLWFNIYPARFFMGDTGIMALGITIGIIAFFTNAPLLLPLIGVIFVIESGSVLLQLISKKLRKKKIFISTPIHHHFEALGWHETRVTMRFWMISAIGALLGLIIFLVDSKLPPLL